MRILDVGAGLGRWTNELVKEFPDAEIIALDHKKRLRTKGVKFVKGSVEKLPFENGTFDLVIVSRLLPYVDIKTSIKEIERVTKTDGLIVYELIQIGYYLKKLLKGELKRILNFINWLFYFKLEFKLFKKMDNIDSKLLVRYYSWYEPVEEYVLKSWRDLPMLSLKFMSNNKPDKQLHGMIKKIAKDILEKET